MGKKRKKTNAERILDTANISYSMYEYAVSKEEKGASLGESAAKAIGVSPDQVFKTLVTQGEKLVIVCVIPVNQHLNLKSLATHAHIKKLEMIPVTQITPLTGYIRGGCSPIGMKKAYPTFLHNSALAHTEIIISAGHVGQQLGIAPQDLIRICNASTGNFVLEE